MSPKLVGGSTHLEDSLKTWIASPHPRTSWCTRPGAGPTNLCFYQVSRWCWCFLGCVLQESDDVGSAHWEPLMWSFMLKRNLKVKESLLGEGHDARVTGRRNRICHPRSWETHQWTVLNNSVETGYTWNYSPLAVHHDHIVTVRSLTCCARSGQPCPAQPGLEAGLLTV